MGAAQVLVEDAGGIRIVWTGDFRLDGTPVVDCDVLVVEATYGSPSCRRNFDVDVRELLVSMIEKRLARRHSLRVWLPWQTPRNYADSARCRC